MKVDDDGYESEKVGAKYFFGKMFNFFLRWIWSAVKIAAVIILAYLAMKKAGWF